MTAVSWLLMLCLVHERPVNHLPIDAKDTSTDSQQLDQKVKRLHMRRTRGTEYVPKFVPNLRPKIRENIFLANV